MGSSPVSVTLAPNIAHLNANLSLIDMIGFQENRNEKSVLSISYFLSSCFEKVDAVKFIVVIAHENLLCKNLDFICGSFNELVEMFAISKFSKEMKDGFMNAIGIVVSSAKENLEYYKTRLGIIAKQLRNMALETIKNRELLVEMLERVAATNKVECFVQAELGKSNGNCNVFERFNMLGWKEFELKKAKQAMKQELLIIPFKQDVSKLSPDAVNKLKKSLNDKVRSIEEIAVLFETYLDVLRQNWV